MDAAAGDSSTPMLDCTNKEAVPTADTVPKKEVGLMSLSDALLEKILRIACDSYDIADRCRKMLPLTAINRRFYRILAPMALEQVVYLPTNPKAFGGFCSYLTGTLTADRLPNPPVSYIKTLRIDDSRQEDPPAYDENDDDENDDGWGHYGVVDFSKYHGILKQAACLTHLQLVMGEIEDEDFLKNLGCGSVTSLSLIVKGTMNCNVFSELGRSLFPNLNELRLQAVGPDGACCGGSCDSYLEDIYNLCPDLKRLQLHDNGKFGTKFLDIISHMCFRVESLDVAYLIFDEDLTFGKGIGKRLVSTKELTVSNVGDVTAFVKGLATYFKTDDYLKETINAKDFRKCIEKIDIKPGKWGRTRVTTAIIPHLKRFPNLKSFHLVLAKLGPNEDPTTVTDPCNAIAAAFPGVFTFELETE